MTRLHVVALAILVVGAGLTGLVTVSTPAGALLTLRGTATSDPGGAVTTLVVNVPSGVLSGELLVAQVTVKTTAVTVTAPACSCWTFIRSDNSAGANPVKQALYYRVAGASEPTTYTWTLGTSVKATAGMYALQGVDQASPIDAQGSNAVASATSGAASAVTSTVTNTLVLYFGGLERDATCALSGGPTKDYSVLVSSGGAATTKTTSCAGQKAVASVGATGAATFTWGNAAAMVFQTVAFRMPRAAFTSVSSSGTEATAAVSAPVTLTGASTKTATVVFAPSGTATSGASCTGTTDYTISPASPLSFAPGVTAGNIAITVCNDTLGESSETIILTLSAPAEAALGATTVFTYTITDDDLFVTPAADPVRADGTADTGVAWGGWAADPAAANVASTNYLKITNTGDQPTRAYTVDFTPTTFAGVTDATQTIVLDTNIQFACWEDATPGTTTPTEAGSFYTFGAASGTGSVTGSFSGLGNIVYCKYQIVSLPALLVDQAYTATYTVT